MKDYQIIEHTADIGIIVSADDRESLFVKAAAAMFDIIAEPSKPTADVKKEAVEINVSGSGTEELFVAWLSELLSLSDCKHIIFTEFDIHKLTDTTLKATTRGIDQKYFTGKSEIKAVTYYDLKVFKEANKFKAQVIFDV